MRFAKALGYSGFPQFKRALIEYYKIYLNPAVRIERYIDNTSDAKLTYQAITKKEIDYLKESIQTINENTFKSAVKAICNTENLYIFGTGSNEPLASHLAYRLSRFSLKVNLISVSGRNLFEKLIRIQNEDLIIVYSFYKPSVDFRRVMQISKEAGCRTILITDSHIPTMIRDASIVLFAKRGPFGSFHSPLVPMAITNALIIGTANRLGKRAIESLALLGKMRKKYYRNEEILR